MQMTEVAMLLTEGDAEVKDEAPSEHLSKPSQLNPEASNSRQGDP
jgi:hypothetical protein